MRTLQGFLCWTLIGFTATAFAAEPVTDGHAVFLSCASEAKTAGCGQEKVGRGLLECLQAYKAANPSFVISDNCQHAVEKRRSDKEKRN